jgi:hypothetical protein
MGRHSALARVFELTKSFAPLGFERHGSARDAGSDNVADALADSAAEPGDVPATLDQLSAAQTLPLPAAPLAPLSGPGVVLAFPAMAQVTVVVPEVLPRDAATLESMPQEIEALDPLPVADETETARHAATANAIASIEADIASLLATLDRSDAEALEESAAGEEDEEPTLALLGELDRLWQADPQIASR